MEVLNAVEVDKWNSVLVDLYNTKNWNGILELERSVPSDIMLDLRKRYLWAWPHLEDLKFMSDIAEEQKLSRGYLSVGCGSGLLEWLLTVCTKTQVTGLEIDESWWNSKYCPVPFLPLNFVSKSDINAIDFSMNKKSVLKSNQEYKTIDENSTTHNDFGLLFCYFNNGQAFNNYINNYKGNVIVIIGPTEGQNVYTEPLPYKPMFSNPNEWNLSSQKYMNNGRDLIAFYKRNNTF